MATLFVLPSSKVRFFEKLLGRRNPARSSWAEYTVYYKDNRGRTRFGVAHPTLVVAKDAADWFVIQGQARRAWVEGPHRKIVYRTPSFETNPIQPLHVQYTGETVWTSIPYRVQEGGRIKSKRLRVKLATDAIAQAMPADLSKDRVPVVTRGKAYTWVVPRSLLEVVHWPEPVDTRIRKSRQDYIPVGMAANPHLKESVHYGHIYINRASGGFMRGSGPPPPGFRYATLQEIRRLQAKGVLAPYH